MVNGASMGVAGDFSERNGFLPLDPGIYQILLRAPGYETWRAEVAVKAPAEPLAVTLERKPAP